MTTHSIELWNLAGELWDQDSLDKILILARRRPLNLEALAEFDYQLGGPNLLSINLAELGNYDVEDREVFRPIQYCEMHFRSGLKNGNLPWLAREIVEMSCLHIESLLKRTSGISRLPMGALLQNAILKRKLDTTTLTRARRFSKILNDAKHNVSHAKDTHLFSISDAVIAYFIARKISFSLFPHAKLHTDLARFRLG